MKTNLRTIRRIKGYTQIAVQMKTGIDQSILSKIESGERLPSIPTMLKLADFYNVSVDYLLNRTSNPAINQ